MVTMAEQPPSWLTTLVERVDTAQPRYFSRFLPPPRGAGRRAGVLVLFGPAATAGARTRESQGLGGSTDLDGAAYDVLLTERAHSMRSHAGQVSFPGGSIEPDDDGAVGAALREANEEVGLDPASVDVLGVVPELYMPHRDFGITPVIGWWRRPHPVDAVDPAEVAQVVRAPLDQLTDPARRFTVTHPSGYRGDAFDVDGLLVWGFTAGVLSRLLALSGLERAWDSSRLEAIPPERWG